ncbi:MAG: chemotaxis protein CheW [Solirubrobacteraceae bacterium]|jgi:purine-binding chemotaxis protein CheW
MNGNELNTHDSQRQIVVFGLGSEEYALTISDVQEIIRYVEPRAVASDSPWIRGVISLRGRIIPVCDLATRLGVTRAERAPAKIIVVEAGSRTVGLIVDDVTEVLTVSEDDIERLRVSANAAEQSIVKVGERLLVLLASDAVFGSSEIEYAV